MTPVVVWALIGLVFAMLLAAWRALDARARRRASQDWIVVLDARRLTPGCRVEVGRRVGCVMVVEGQRVLVEWRRR